MHRFLINTMKLTKLKTYLTAPTKCFVQKCKARCCINVPLPEGFLPKHKEKVQREIFGGFNMGINDPKDTYNSIIYSTRPIIYMGQDQNGNMLATIPPEMVEKLNIQSMEDVHRLLNEFEAKKIYNYCPFIKNDARCSIYTERPSICREFGTASGKENICPEKASRLEIAKYKIKYIIDYQKEVFKTMWDLIKKKKIIDFD